VKVEILEDKMELREYSAWEEKIDVLRMGVQL
jgi:hypothetical protein